MILKARSPRRASPFAPVARDARPIIDKRELFADQPIEQGRLADIRAADDRDREHYSGLLLGRRFSRAADCQFAHSPAAISRIEPDREEPGHAYVPRPEPAGRRQSHRANSQPRQKRSASTPQVQAARGSDRDREKIPRHERREFAFEFQRIVVVDTQHGDAQLGKIFEDWLEARVSQQSPQRP